MHGEDDNAGTYWVGFAVKELIGCDVIEYKYLKEN